MKWKWSVYNDRAIKMANIYILMCTIGQLKCEEYATHVGERGSLVKWKQKKYSSIYCKLCFLGCVQCESS